jgi:hypothetical protein
MHNIMRSSHTVAKRQEISFFYRMFGLPMLKRIIMGTIGPMVLLVNRRQEMPSYFVGDPFDVRSLHRTLKWLYFNEAVHLSLILVTGAIGYSFWRRGYMEGVVFMGIIIMLNIFLALLQRMNRARIRRTVEALERRETVKR